MNFWTNFRTQRVLFWGELSVTALWVLMVAGSAFYPSTLLVLPYVWLLVYVAVKHPRWLPALLVAAFPLEASKHFFPVLSMEERAGGFKVSYLDFFRLGQAALFLRMAFDLQREGGIRSFAARFKGNVLFYLPLVLVALYLVSGFAGINLKHSLAETARIVTLILTFYGAVYYIRQEKDLLNLGFVFIVAGSILGAVGLGEYLSGHFFFNATPAVVVSRRANATFADPNILARFLIVTFLFSVAALENSKGWRKRVFPVTAMAFQGVGLAITGSRGGLLALAVSALIFALFIPRRKLTLTAMGLMLAAIIAAALLNPLILSRLESLRSGLFMASGDIREYLWRAGIAMVRDYPLLGVGPGNFGPAFTGVYPYFNPYSTFSVYLSHTALLTVLAETGFVGAAFLYLLFGKVLQKSWQVHRGTLSETLRFIAAASAASVFAIFVSAQGEGRLYEEPALWLLFAVLVVLMQFGDAKKKGNNGR